MKNQIRTLSFFCVFFLFACQNQNQTVVESSEISEKKSEQDKTPKSDMGKDLNPLLNTATDTSTLFSSLILAETLFEQELLDSSLAIANDALELSEKIYEKENSTAASAYMLLGKIKFRRSQFEEALVDYTRSLEHFFAISGEETTPVARVYNLMGDLYLKRRLLDKALEYFQKAERIQFGKKGDEKFNIGDVYQNLGVVWDDKGNYEKAITYYKKALTHRQEEFGEKHLKLSDIHLNLSIAMYSRGDLDSALYYANNALEIDRSNYGDSHFNVASSHLNLGVFYHEKGDFIQSRNHFEKALEIFLQMKEKNPNYIAFAYNNLGIVWDDIGNYNKALEFYEKALDLKTQYLGSNNPELSITLNNLGIVYRELGDLDMALEFYQKSLDIDIKTFGPDHKTLCSTYNNIGIVWQKKGDNKKALEFYEKSLAIREKERELNHKDIGYSLLNIGTIYYKQKEYQKAKEKFQKALANWKEALGVQHPIVSLALENIGMCFEKEGKLEIAKYYFDNALGSLGFEVKDSSSFSKVFNLNRLHKVLQTHGEYYKTRFIDNEEIAYKDSLKKNYQLLISLEDHIQKIYRGDVRQFYLAQSLPVYEGAIRNIIDYFPNELEDSFILSEKAKGRFLSEKAKSESLGNPIGLPDSIHNKILEVNVDIAFFEKRLYEETYEKNTPTDSLVQHFKNKLFELKGQKENLINLIHTNFPEYFNLLYNLDAISIKEVQQSLLKSSKQALVEYFVGDSTILTFTILKDTFYISETKRNFPLDDWIQKMRCTLFDGFVSDSLCTGINFPEYSIVAHNLYEKLFSHVDSLLPENSEVIIIPDGVLGYLPFEALLTKSSHKELQFKNFPHLLRKHAISYAPSATLLHIIENKKHNYKASEKLVAFAPFASKLLPDVIASRNNLEELPYSGIESREIAKIFNGIVWLEENATKEKFINTASDFQILHLSTHGQANDRLGDYSFLAFHPLEDSIDITRLYNRELYNLQLNADMVVLSACETGIGELQKGEGIISLARGFSYAGAKSIVTSLWNVNDQSTQVLMELFYQNLKAGMNKRKALQKAKLEYLEEHPNLGQEPYFWAAFIPIGDMSPIELSDSLPFNWWVLGGILLLGIMGWVFFRKKIN